MVRLLVFHVRWERVGVLLPTWVARKHPDVSIAQNDAGEDLILYTVQLIKSLVNIELVKAKEFDRSHLELLEGEVNTYLFAQICNSIDDLAQAQSACP